MTAPKLTPEMMEEALEIAREIAAQDGLGGLMWHRLARALLQRDEEHRLLAQAVNEYDGGCVDACNSYGHAAECNTGMDVTLSLQQADIIRLRAEVSRLKEQEKKADCGACSPEPCRVDPPCLVCYSIRLEARMKEQEEKIAEVEADVKDADAVLQNAWAAISHVLHDDEKPFGRTWAESAADTIVALRARVKEVEEDFGKCYDLATKAASLWPAEREVWTGTVSERLVRLFTIEEAACEQAETRALAAESRLSEMRGALEYLIDEPGHSEFKEYRLDPIVKHWSHTGPQDRPYLRCPRCVIDAALGLPSPPADEPEEKA